MADVRTILEGVDLNAISTADRLRLVADLIEQNPDRWDQTDWITGPLLHTCDTAGCVGGWGEALDPSVVSDFYSGHRAFGFTAALGEAIFYGTVREEDPRPDWLPNLLRRLADLSVPRTWSAALELIEAENLVPDAWTLTSMREDADDEPDVEIPA